MLRRRADRATPSRAATICRLLRPFQGVIRLQPYVLRTLNVAHRLALLVHGTPPRADRRWEGWRSGQRSPAPSPGADAIRSPTSSGASGAARVALPAEALAFDVTTPPLSFNGTHHLSSSRGHPEVSCPPSTVTVTEHRKDKESLAWPGRAAAPAPQGKG